jgi:SAM-dependent methyltransferase
MSFRELLQPHYAEMLRTTLPQGTQDIPEHVRKFFVNLTGFEAIWFVCKMVGEAHQVLVIGDLGGRDYYSLRLLGKQVYVLDIANQPDIKHLVLGDVTKPLPFSDQSFDAVVVGEVLEHLIEDHVALQLLRRVLKSDGQLIVTVPCMHDIPEYHVRVHTPKTICRLLRASGFEPETMVQRGGLISFDGLPFMLLLHGVNLLAYTIIKRTFYKQLLEPLVKIDWQIGLAGWRILRFSQCWGAYILCRKGNVVDFRQLNVEAFSA